MSTLNLLNPFEAQNWILYRVSQKTEQTLFFSHNFPASTALNCLTMPFILFLGAVEADKLGRNKKNSKFNTIFSF